MTDWTVIAHKLHGHSPLFLTMLGLAVAVWIFLPTLIAALRRHRSFKLIALINLVFFWEFWIWVPLMAWACMDRSGDTMIARFEALRAQMRGLFSRNKTP